MEVPRLGNISQSDNPLAAPLLTTATSPPSKRVDISAQQPLYSFALLLPEISELYRESKSTTPQLLLNQLAINSRLLCFEIYAIKIQTYFRRFFAIQRTARIRRRLETFCRVSERCSERFIEEAVLQASFEISLSFIRNNLRYKRLMQSIEAEILFEIEDMIEEHVNITACEVVAETFNAVIEAVMNKRGKQQQQGTEVPLPSSSPLLLLLGDICDDAADSFLRDIAIESILEEARGHIINSYAVTALQETVLPEVVLDLTEKVLWEVLTIQYGHYSSDITQPMVQHLEREICKRDGNDSIYRQSTSPNHNQSTTTTIVDVATVGKATDANTESLSSNGSSSDSINHSNSSGRNNSDELNIPAVDSSS